MQVGVSDLRLQIPWQSRESLGLWIVQVFELMKKQEDTRQSEENARKAEYQALQAQHETVCYLS